MKFVIKSILKALIVPALILAQLYYVNAQTTTASILPPAKTTFFDQNGNPLTSGKVYFYIPGGTVPKTTWQDAAETIPNTNPVQLDAAGRAIIYGFGTYRQDVFDRNNNLQWSQVTSSPGSGSGGSTATGDGDLVGTIKPWAGMTAPNQYVFTYGQELNRALYPALYTAITSTQPVFCNTGSGTLNGLGDTTNFWIGMKVETSCTAGAGHISTVVSKTATTVTIADLSNVTTNSTATFFPWGNGNGSTTFNLPDLRGYVLAGNDIMGGTAAGILTTPNFGSQTPDASGAGGGAQTRTLLAANLPPHTHTSPTLTDPGHTHGIPLLSNVGAVSVSSASTNAGPVPDGATRTATTGITLSASTGTNASGTSTPFTTIQPTKTTNFIIKITPDSNSATASGVTSLGLMTGDIACGTGLLCTGNTISSTISAGIIGPGSSTDKAIATWAGTAGNSLNNSTVTIPAANTLSMNPDGSPIRVVYYPSNLASSTLIYGNGGTNLVHNAGTFTGTISGTVLTVSAITTGTVPVERLSTATLSCGACTVGTQIRAQLTGSSGSTGTYTVSPGQTVASPNSMTAISLQGYYNTMAGQTNFLNATTASYNTGMGFEVFEFCTTCFANTAIGEASQIYNQTGSGNTSAGWKSLLGANGFSYGDYNTAMGYSSGWAPTNPTGITQNSSFGAFSLSAATLSGSGNQIFGYGSGSGITSGANNAIFGLSAGVNIATGSNNTIMGACNSGYVAGTGNLVQLCDGAGNVVFSGAGTGGGVSLGSPLNVASGGTAANLNATGGASQVLQQTGVGAAITVGQLSSSNISDMSTAWTAFTPSFSCGTATFTNNSARFKTWGKTTHVEIDFTITAIGTCTNGIFFTLPNTANSGGGVSGREFGVSSKLFGCDVRSASTTATCTLADFSNFANGAHGLASGVYENQ